MGQSNIIIKSCQIFYLFIFVGGWAQSPQAAKKINLRG